MVSQSVRQVASALVAIGIFGAIAQAQVPEKRARSQARIPTRKDIPEKPATAAAPVNVVVPGKNMVVYAPPVVTRIVTSEAGVPTVIVERAPTIGAPVSWLPLLGLLGGAALIGTLGSHNGSGGEEVATTPPPVTPPIPPPVIPPTTVPEPATLALFATGLAGLAVAQRRRRIA